jgi:sugar lactone lactonase YvrE
MQAFSDSISADPDFAIGEPDLSNCSELVLPTWAPIAPEQPESLTLAYPTPVLASQIDIFYIGQPAGILRVEVLNSLSGLGRLVYDGEQAALSPPEAEQCPAKLSLPVQVDFEVDLVIVTIAASKNPIQIDTVGLTGKLLGYIEPPVFWRVPLPGTPVNLTMSADGLIYAVSEPKALSTYDLEGNQLEQFSAPSETLLNRNAAVSPVDGNLYILKGATLQVYTPDTAELLREMALDDIQAYASLVFSPDGRLFSLRNPQWQPELLQLDPLTGAELDAIPLYRADQYPIEITVRGLAIDASGNFYILFGMNTGQIAIHVLDPQGSFVSRFGRLTAETDDWPEGAFFDPRAIAVSTDGRFVIVADGYEENSYLTAFLLEPEQ